ncbi:unnamed protein product (macronuclear) [Paramecium tetraurelia]|uniref:ATP-grasp domain-containing protein n=1 Tax=Paramecium tetraurelia TaxID=5888 RepID=A0CRD5_PARTE|nr:uncharacterized protein GSPATT00009667001 [Paramecium tetraurelia]CAK73352.1 unnamed protein product [Paramecium tetraurelia]|eukprot:XP_001440749.1 hypothetical protein (macronuclear) [Paramecium tetraurelia strain d4-2]
MSDEQLTILFMINPDPIFYGMMDQLIIETFQRLKVNVIVTELEELSVIVGNEITFYRKGEPIHFDAFLAYGYMAPKHYQDYMYFNFAVHSAGKITLHHPSTESILQNKLLQYLKFSENQVPIPRCGASFSLNTFKQNLRRFNDKAIIKEVEGYEGTGVKLSVNHNQSTELFCKSMWNGEQAIIQDFVDDTVGRSIRVLVIGGKAVSVTEFQDNVDFKSNGYSDDFRIESKMDSDKKQEYFKFAERACAAIDPHLTIGGVDILDSRKNGIVVLEINSWPEMTFSQEATGLPLFDQFGQEFIEKIISNNRERTNST